MSLTVGCSDIREEVLEHLIQESENSADTTDTNDEYLTQMNYWLI